jgi:hypothetical protein
MAASLFGLAIAHATAIGNGLGDCVALTFCSYRVAPHRRDQLLHVRYRSGWFGRKLLPIRPGEVNSDRARAPSGMIAVPSAIFSFDRFPERAPPPLSGPGSYALISRNDRYRHLLCAL